MAHRNNTMRPGYLVLSTKSFCQFIITELHGHSYALCIKKFICKTFKSDLNTARNRKHVKYLKCLNDETLNYQTWDKTTTTRQNVPQYSCCITGSEITTEPPTWEIWIVWRNSILACLKTWNIGRCFTFCYTKTAMIWLPMCVKKIGSKQWGGFIMERNYTE